MAGPAEGRMRPSRTKGAQATNRSGRSPRTTTTPFLVKGGGG